MRFKVGDVCYFQGLHSRCVEFNGTECCIVGDLQVRYGDSSHVERLCYSVRCALDGQLWLCEPEYLRLRRPPSWDKWLYDTSGVDSEREVSLEVSNNGGKTWRAIT